MVLYFHALSAEGYRALAQPYFLDVLEEMAFVKLETLSGRQEISEPVLLS